MIFLYYFIVWYLFGLITAILCAWWDYIHGDPIKYGDIPFAFFIALFGIIVPIVRIIIFFGENGDDVWLQKRNKK